MPTLTIKQGKSLKIHYKICPNFSAIHPKNCVVINFQFATISNRIGLDCASNERRTTKREKTSNKTIIYQRNHRLLCACVFVMHVMGLAIINNPKEMEKAMRNMAEVVRLLFYSFRKKFKLFSKSIILCAVDYGTKTNK